MGAKSITFPSSLFLFYKMEIITISQVLGKMRKNSGHENAL